MLCKQTVLHCYAGCCAECTFCECTHPGLLLINAGVHYVASACQGSTLQCVLKLTIDLITRKTAVVQQRVTH